IASLSVLTVAATITAITVPVVMNANQISSDNSIKNDTVKTATIKSSSMADQILKADSEQVMITKVKEFNANKKWDEVFSFTNENDGSLTNVVKEVIFSLESNTIAVFAINYNDDVKITNGANIVKATVNIVDNFVTRVPYFNGIISDITNKLNDLLKKQENKQAQKKLYDSWTTTPKEIENGLVDSFKFDTTDNWNTVVKNISVIPGSYQIDEPMPPLRIQVNLNSWYITSSLDKELLKFNINVDPLMKLDIYKSNDYETKLKYARTALTLLLINKDFNAQKAEYESWEKTTPNDLVTAIEGIVKFKNVGSINNENLPWNDIFESVTIATGIFPALPGQYIPGVEITININNKYSFNQGQKYLTFNMGTFGGSSNIALTVDNSPQHATKLTNAANALKELLNVGVDTISQQEIYDGWAITTPPKLVDEIIDIVFFKDDSTVVDWVKAVEEVKIIPNDKIPLESGQPIPPIKIQIILNDKYDSTDKTNLTIDITELGNAK
ncbi:MAG: hypothetical protein ACRC8C_01130, partial [Mycoplasmoidaceae bacterium]